jgi:hypothetical protein
MKNLRALTQKAVAANKLPTHSENSEGARFDPLAADSLKVPPSHDVLRIRIM